MLQRLLHCELQSVLQCVAECCSVLGHFPQKTPVISGSFAERDIQLKASYASSPPCVHVCACVCVRVGVCAYVCVRVGVKDCMNQGQAS